MLRNIFKHFFHSFFSQLLHPDFSWEGIYESWMLNEEDGSWFSRTDCQPHFSPRGRIQHFLAFLWIDHVWFGLSLALSVGFISDLKIVLSVCQSMSQSSVGFLMDEKLTLARIGEMDFNELEVVPCICNTKSVWQWQPPSWFPLYFLQPL